MSDISSPVTTHQSYLDGDALIRKPEDALLVQIVQLLTDVRTELRVLNTSIQIGLNVADDLDRSRQDPYFSGPLS